MDFNFDEDHQMLQQQIREFATNVVAPGAAERDQAACMSPEFVQSLAEMGFFGLAIPEAYGGAGLGSVASSILVEELSKACAGTGVLLSAHQSLCADPIMMFGTEEQKKKYLPKMATGEWIGCLSLTEPGSGSDAGAAICRADLKDDGWHVEGTKIFVTNGNEAEIMVLIAVTDPDDPKHRLSAFIVEKSHPGVRIGKLEKKLGIRCSSTAEIVYENCVIPRDALLGERGRGLKVALSTLNGGRIGIASQALGIAEACRHESAEYAKTRVQFGQPIGNFQAIQNKLADIYVDVEAARVLTHRAAWCKQTGRKYVKEAAMAKLFASEACTRAANHAVQVFGGYGYCNEYPVERLLRDAKITELYEGTSEIHRIVIARQLASAIGK